MAKKSQQQPKYSEWPCEVQFLRQFRLPEKGRKQDREFHERRKKLLENHQFKKDLIRYRQVYPMAYWKLVPELWKEGPNYHIELLEACRAVMKRHEKKSLGKAFSVKAPWVELHSRTDAISICKKWGLEAGDFRWIEWLCKSWDPEKKELPQGEPKDILPDFNLWHVAIEAAAYPEDWKPRKAILTLRPGISQTSAMDGVKQAIENLKSKTNVGGQPALTDDEENILNELFTKYHTDKLKRKNIIDFAFNQAQAQGLRIGHSTVEMKYRDWLVKEKKGSIKKYGEKKKGEDKNEMSISAL